MKSFIKKLMVAILVLAIAVIPTMGSYAATGVTFSGVGEIPNLRQGRPYDITGTVKKLHISEDKSGIFPTELRWQKFRTIPTVLL